MPAAAAAAALWHVPQGCLVAFVALGAFVQWVLPYMFYPDFYTDWHLFSCDEGAMSPSDEAAALMPGPLQRLLQGARGRGWCGTNRADLWVANKLVLAPRATGYISHAFTFGACPWLAVRSLHDWREDGSIWMGTQLISAGLNQLAKRGAQRQRPCFYFGREELTQAAEMPGWQQWVSFYSGDTAMAWSFVWTAVALARMRGRLAVSQRLLRVGGVLAAIGSLLRIVGDMHWCSDVLVGGAMGWLVGYGVPTLLFAQKLLRNE